MAPSSSVSPKFTLSPCCPGPLNYKCYFGNRLYGLYDSNKTLFQAGHSSMGEVNSKRWSGSNSFLDYSGSLYLLGPSEPSSFYHACSVWLTNSPSALWTTGVTARLTSCRLEERCIPINQRWSHTPSPAMEWATVKRDLLWQNSDRKLTSQFARTT